MTPVLRVLALLLLVLAPVASLAQPATETNGYRLPPKSLQAIVDAPRAPLFYLSPHRDQAALLQLPALPGIAVVAQPELRTAGLRINPRAYAPSRFTFGSDLWLLDVGTGAEARIEGLPAPLSVAAVAWSPDQAHVAFHQVDARSGANELWVVDVAARKARRIAERLNNVSNHGVVWMPDSRGLLVLLRPEGAVAPVVDAVPTGPAVQESIGGGAVKQLRTFADLLRNESDARVFAHYNTAQLARVGLDGTVAKLGAPELYFAASPSPDGRFVLAQVVERPFSYVVPVFYFPRRIEVLDVGTGKPVHTVAKLPLFDGLPTGND